MNQDSIAICTVCGWLGTDSQWYEGHEVCPECLSEVEWNDATIEPVDDEPTLEELDFALTGEPAYASSRMAAQRSREWLRSYAGRTAGFNRGPSDTVVASKARQELLKGAMAELEQVGMAMRARRDSAQEGARLLRWTGRVCVARAEVQEDPCA